MESLSTLSFTESRISLRVALLETLISKLLVPDDKVNVPSPTASLPSMPAREPAYEHWRADQL